MFLFTLTKGGVSSNFRSGKVEEFALHSWKVTVVTDGFLSTFLAGEDGFSVVESPLLGTAGFRECVFVKVSYDAMRDVVSVFKSTISGRPVYYHVNPRGEFFCSTHISMLRAAGVPIEENVDVLPEFFVFRFIMAPYTLFKNIFQLTSGEELHVQMKDNKTIPVRNYKFTPPEPIKKEDITTVVGHTLELLTKSIQTLDPLHDRISVLLSGGLDSSILFRICQMNYHIDTSYSTGFPFENPLCNLEKEYSISAANLFQTKHLYLDMTSTEYFHGLIHSISNAEVPIHHLQSVPIYQLFRKIPQATNIIISGLGADDLFGTITQYNQFHFEQNLVLKLLIKYIRTSYIKYLLSALHRDWKNYAIIQENYKKSTVPITDPNHLVWSIGVYGSEEWAAHHFNKKSRDIIQNRYSEIIRFHRRSLYDIISLLLLQGSASTTQAIWSKLAEREKKILYCPFTDIDIITHAFSIPWDIKLKKPKNILRIVAHQINIPSEIITRQKSGFGINPELWAQKGGIFETLLPLAKKSFDEEEIRKMQSSDIKKAMIYWNMINYSIWKRVCINNEPVSALIDEIA